MARAVAMVGGLSGGRRTLVVDWGFSNTTLCIVGDERPLYSRRIQDCAFGQILESIVERFDVSLDEAQHFAETEGLVAGNEIDRPSSDTAAAITDCSYAAYWMSWCVRSVERCSSPRCNAGTCNQRRFGCWAAERR